MTVDDFSAGALAAADGETIAACPWGPTEVEGHAWRQGWFHGEQARRQAAGTFDHTAEFYEELARSENRAAAPTDPVIEILGGYDQDATGGRIGRLLDRAWAGINPQPDVVWKVSIPVPSVSIYEIRAAVARLQADMLDQLTRVFIDEIVNGSAPFVHDVPTPPSVLDQHCSIQQKDMPESPPLSIWFDDRSMLYAKTVNVEETIRQLTP